MVNNGLGLGFTYVVLGNYNNADADSWYYAGMADINGDGFDDVFASATVSGSTVWWRSVGDGTFTNQAGTPAPVAGDPVGVGRSIDSMDANGDGRAELVWSDGGDMGVFLNQGPAHAVTWTSVNLGAWVSAAVGDFDRDGFDDLLVHGAPPVTKLLFSHMGVVASKQMTLSGPPMHRIMTADVDGDGLIDVVSFEGSFANVYLGLPDHPFVDLSKRVAGGGTSSNNQVPQPFDLDDNGILDLVFWSASWDTVAGTAYVDMTEGRVVNSGATPYISSTSFDARAIAVADADPMDGYPDLVVSTSSQGRLYYYDLFPLGVFGGPGETLLPGTTGVTSSAFADLDANGELDAVWSLGDGSAWVSFNHGGTLGAPRWLAGGVSTLATSDINADAAYDVVMASAPNATLSVALNDGYGMFTAPLPIPVASGSSAPTVFQLCNINHDWDVDLAWATASGALLVAVNTGGTGPVAFAPPVPVAMEASGIDAIAVDDINGDGHNDIVWLSVGAGKIECALAVPGGGWQTPVTLVSGGPGVISLAVGHIDSDPHLDIVWGVPGNNGVHWQHGNGDGTFAGRPPFSLPHDAAGIRLLDAQNSRTSHIITVSGDGTKVSWMVRKEGAKDANVPVTNSATGASFAGGLWPVDVSGSGTYAVVYATSGGLVVSAPSHTPGRQIWSAARLHLRHPECGGVSNSVACLAAAFARLQPCVALGKSRWMELPGNIGNCVRAGPLKPIRGHVRLRPGPGISRSVIQCRRGDTGGGFAHVTGTLEAERVDVLGLRGTARNKDGWTVDGATVILHESVVADSAGHAGACLAAVSSALHFSDVAFRGCMASNTGGALLLSGQGVVFDGKHVTFEGNAAQGTEGVSTFARGGAVVMRTTSAMFTCDFCDWRDNHAVGSGGALFLRDSTATVRLLNNTFLRNRADVSGGAFAVVADDHVGPQLELIGAGTVVSGHRATWGGTLSLSSADIQFPHDGNTIAVPLSTSLAGPKVVIDAGIRVDNSSALYGGLMFVCDALLQADHIQLGGPIHAAHSGGRVFSCAPYSSTWFELPSLANTSHVFSASVVSPIDATPPVSLSLDPATPAPWTSPSGIPLGAARVIAYDALGTAVLAPVSVVSADAHTVITPDYVYDEAATAVDVSETVVSLVSWPELLDSPVAVDVAVLGSPFAEASVRVEVRLGACPEGMGRSSGESVSLVCAPCLNDAYSNTTDTSPCVSPPECVDDEILVDGVCVGCPALSYRAVNGSTVGPCMCQEGAWVPSGVYDVACEPCPTGGVCEGRLARPYATPGWRSLDEDGNFARCPVEEACLGSDACSPEYDTASFLCKDCGENTYRRSDGTCARCPEQSTLFFVGFLALILLICLGSFLLVMWTYSAIGGNTVGDGDTSSDGAEEGGEHGRPRRQYQRRMVPFSLSVALIYLQVLSLLCAAPFDWPKQVRDTMAFADIANIDLSLFRVGCSVKTYEATFLLSVLLPAFMIVCVMVMAVVVRVCRCGSHRLPIKFALTRILFSVGPLAYIPLCRASLVFFDCRQLPDGKWYLEEDLTVRCFTGSWMQLAIVAVLAVLFYVVALPLIFAVLLYRNRRVLDDPHVFAMLGPIYVTYRRAFYYTECLMLIKKLMIVCVALFLNTVPSLLFAVLIAVFLVFGSWQQRNMPYFLPLHNTLQGRLDASLIALLLFGILFWADNFPSRVAKTVVIVVCIISIALSVLSLVWAAVQEIRVYGKAHTRVGREELSRIRDGVLMQTLEKHLPDLYDPASVVPRLQSMIPHAISSPHKGAASGTEATSDSQQTDQGQGTPLALVDVSTSCSSFETSDGAKEAFL